MIILLCGAFVRELKYNVLVRNLREELGKNPGPRDPIAHINYLHANYPPTRRRLFRVPLVKVEHLLPS